MLAHARFLNRSRLVGTRSSAPSARVLLRRRKCSGDAAARSMAAPAKRARVSGGSPLAAPCPFPRAARPPEPLPAGPSGGEPEGDAVAGFLSWCTRVGLELSPKVMVSRQGTVAGYGMVARESVQPGELLFAVPRSALLSPQTCSISGLLERGGSGAGDWL